MSGTVTLTPALKALPSCRTKYTHRKVNVRSGASMAAAVEALLALGYTSVHWRPMSGGCFAAMDDSGIPSLVIADVAPMRDGRPLPRLSPARRTWMCDLGQAYLQDRTRLRKVRVDYLVIPEGVRPSDGMPVTLRRGVAWAFAHERRVPTGGGGIEIVRVIFGIADAR